LREKCSKNGPKTLKAAQLIWKGRFSVRFFVGTTSDLEIFLRLNFANKLTDAKAKGFPRAWFSGTYMGGGT
jgi:hypothetical protein